MYERIEKHPVGKFLAECGICLVFVVGFVLIAFL